MMDEKALIWPAAPTDMLNVWLISISSKPVISPDGCVANLARTSEGNISLACLVIPYHLLPILNMIQLRCELSSNPIS